ncbi:protein of unknown function (DU1801) [Mesorhizobium albiziae]|uniref:YdhG-like domain-containing protein n=2 Tax=Neomesorhizobium albiziae TaxID=335020 RepID=A0A1I3YUN2_9HYPH|nr:protein of unknown function (DU1801) [Mesorhizobium albiziae]
MKAMSAMPAHVAAVFDACPAAARERLLALRRLIFDTAATTDGVGPLTETLKWGEPAYLTEVSRSGSTIRLGWKASRPQQCAVYFNCKTTLVDTFRSLFPEELVFEGNRAILLDLSTPLPEMPLALCFSMAMTYRREKR